MGWPEARLRVVGGDAGDRFLFQSKKKTKEEKEMR